MANPVKSVAVLSIRQASKMTKRGRRQVAAWIRKEADFLEEFGEQLSDNFRSRYIAKEK